MPLELDGKAVEKSTYVITLSFKDESGSAVTPNSANWTLTDGAGAVINNRENVVITPAESVDIVLRGADLALSENDNGMRLLTVEALYNSSLGNDLPLKDSVKFYIVNLVKIE